MFGQCRWKLLQNSVDPTAPLENVENQLLLLMLSLSLQYELPFHDENTSQQYILKLALATTPEAVHLLTLGLRLALHAVEDHVVLEMSSMSGDKELEK
jgi:hypothetical protein